MARRLTGPEPWRREDDPARMGDQGGSKENGRSPYRSLLGRWRPELLQCAAKECFRKPCGGDLSCCSGAILERAGSDSEDGELAGGLSGIWRRGKPPLSSFASEGSPSPDEVCRVRDIPIAQKMFDLRGAPQLLSITLLAARGGAVSPRRGRIAVPDRIGRVLQRRRDRHVTHRGRELGQGRDLGGVRVRIAHDPGQALLGQGRRQ